MRVVDGWQLAHTANVLAVTSNVSRRTSQYLMLSNLEEVVKNMVYFHDMTYFSEGMFANDLIALGEGVLDGPVRPFSLDLKECWALAEDKFEQDMLITAGKGNLIMDFYNHPLRGGVYLLLTGDRGAKDIFEEEYGERYSYWDDKDRPSEINDDEWSYRGEIWRNVLGGDEPRQPMQYSVLRANQVLPRVSSLSNATTAPRVPSTHSRIVHLMDAMIAKEYFKTNPVNTKDAAFLDYYYSPFGEIQKSRIYSQLHGSVKDIPYTEIIDYLH